jgi:ATP-dependent DNA helicase RecG
LFEDKVEANLFNMVGKVLELLKAKYIKGTDIHSSSAKWEYPENAVREAIINSVVNKDYTGFFIFDGILSFLSVQSENCRYIFLKWVM